MTQTGSPQDDTTFPDFLDDYFAECDEHLTGGRVTAGEVNLANPGMTDECLASCRTRWNNVDKSRR